MKMTTESFIAIRDLVKARINEIDDTECNNAEVRRNMNDEREVLCLALGELVAAR